MINIRENEDLHVLNHSCAHLMAQAVKHLYPNAKFWVGPVIDDGFYYDMDLDGASIKEEDFEKIEREMKKISKDGKRIVRIELTKEEALEMFKEDEYKIDLINNMEEGSTITAYKQGDYTDLCKGPHVETVKEIKYFKLLKASGAYYKGDSKNKMLQRVYGVCFRTEEDLNKHLYEIEEAKKRDHRKLGKELGLFMLSDYGPGLPFWLPNGYVLRRELEDFWLREHHKAGYIFVDTPIMLNRELWETSGHWDHYKDDMFVVEVEDGTYAIKPMNCPGAIQVYNNDLHSYKDLPMRIAELGHVHRYEASGALNGLFRVRGFTQDDAHILLREDQIGEEVSNIIALYDRIYSVFGLNYAIELSTRPFDNYIGNVETWDAAEEALKKACLATGHEFKINPGDGAFYGPKLDFKLRDSLNRIWQCGTIQLDMQLPGRFNCTYIDANGEKVTPIMIHRACFGSLERFIGIITENYAGAFPTWLSPVQVKILPVNNEYHLEYANEIYKKLDDLGIRASVDSREEKLGYRMREAQTKKIPYQLVLGDKEKESNTLNVRTYGSNDSKSMGVDEFIDMIKKEIAELKSR